MMSSKLITNFLKNIYRSFKYQYKILKFKKPNYQLDSKFPIMDKMRKEGIVCVQKFQNQSDEAKRLLDFFHDFIKKTIYQKINDPNKNKTHKSFYKFNISSLFNEKDLINLSNNSFINSNVEQYFGFKPDLREINVSVDYKGEHTSPKFTQLFHRDGDDVKLLKVFMYLTDVDIDNGPFQYIAKSHIKPWKDQDINKGSIFTATGKSGQIIFCDTNGLHRGLILNKGYRVMLTLVYTSSNPITGKLEKIIS